MTTLILCVVAIAVLAYHRSAPWLWILTFALIFVAAGYLSLLSQALLWAIWSIFILILVLVGVTPVRRKMISRHFFSVFKKQLPKMSATEKEALSAGTIGWEAELFSGKPNWNKLHAPPAPQLTDEERAFLDGPVEELCGMLDDWAITHVEHDLPEPVWNFIRQRRFFGMIIPRHYGGLEFSAQAHSDVIMKISTRSITAAVTVMVPNSLGPGMLLMKYGTETQKNHYLPRLARGEEIPCFALTAPEAGSDAGGMTDYGVVCRGEFEGKQDVLGIRVSWNKRYITLCPVATLLGLAFKLYDPDHLLGDQDSIGITLALIPTSHPGVVTGRRHLPANLPFQNGPTSGRDVFIPLDWVIGGRDGVGLGWRMLMECLADGRGISLPALSTAAGKSACRTTGAYARIRRQFNLPIGRFEGVQAALARMTGLTYIMDAARTFTLSAIDQGGQPAVSTAIAKYYLTEAMRQVINDAFDVHGGKAIMHGPRNYLADAYQAIPIGITVEGSNILTRNMIIFGQGAIRCHPYVLREIEAATEMDEANGLYKFDQALFGHIGFLFSNAVRTVLLGVTAGRVHRPPATDASARYYRQLQRMSAAFALLADISMMMLGGSLKRRENLSARLADVLGNLYLCSAVLKQFRDQGGQHEDVVLLDWSCQHCLHNVQEAIYDFLDNFPNGAVAFVLNRFIFPYGRPYPKPSDELGASAASILLSPSGARDRLTGGIFLPETGDHPVRLQEDALHSIIAAEPLIDKLREGMQAGQIKVKNLEEAVEEAVQGDYINDHEAEIVRKAVSLCDRVIAVDDFDPDEFHRREA